MKKVYYEFNGDLYRADDDFRDKFIQSNWNTSSCPFSKLPTLVGKLKSIKHIFDKLKDDAYYGNIPYEQYVAEKNDVHATIRTCPGVNRILKTSYMLTAPCDMHLSVTAEETAELIVADEKLAKITMHHPSYQHTTTEGEKILGDNIMVKFNMPYAIKSEVPLMFLQPQMHGSQSWTVINGVLPEKRAHQMAIILSFPRPKSGQEHYMIKKGTVLSYLWSSEKTKLVKSKSRLVPYQSKFIGNV